MRKFLDDPKYFTWPESDCREGLHYKFSADHGVRELLDFKRPLTRTWFRADLKKTKSVLKTRSVVQQWQVNESKRDKIFKYPFVVKRLTLDVGNNHEVLAMADLRYPHISALLGTYWSEGCLWLLAFPAGCYDLGDFMRCISDNLKSI
jgi:hypothetical protein